MCVFVVVVVVVVVLFVLTLIRDLMTYVSPLEDLRGELGFQILSVYAMS